MPRAKTVKDPVDEKFWNSQADRDGGPVGRRFTKKLPRKDDRLETKCDVVFAGSDGEDGKKHIHFFTPQTEQNMAFVAGCLGVGNTFAMRRVFAQDEFVAIATVFEQAREVNFLTAVQLSGTVEKPKSIATSQVMNILADPINTLRLRYLWNLDPSKPWSKDLIKELNSQVADEIQPHQQGLWCFARAVLNMIRALPASFPESVNFTHGHFPASLNDCHLALYAFRGYRILRMKGWKPKAWGLSASASSDKTGTKNASNAQFNFAFKIFVEKEDLPDDEDEGAPYLATIMPLTKDEDRAASRANPVYTASELQHQRDMVNAFNANNLTLDRLKEQDAKIDQNPEADESGDAAAGARIAASLRGVSMAMPSYLEAVKVLFPNGEGETLIDSHTQHAERAKRKLYKYQVQAIYNIRQAILDGPLNGIVLGDGCGLGKSLTVLVAFLLIAREYNERNPSGPYRPILLVCPPSVTGVWLLEYTRFFQSFLSCSIFQGSSETQDTSTDSARRIISSLDLLKAFYLPKGKFDPTDPRTSTKMVITSYPTYARRTLFDDQLVDKLKSAAAKDVDAGTVSREEPLQTTDRATPWT